MESERFLEVFLRELVSTRYENPALAVMGLMGHGIIYQRDALTVAAALLKTDDPALREIAQRVIITNVFVTQGDLDDDDVEYFLRRNPPNDNQELVELMIRTSPERGMRVMASTVLADNDAREMLWAEHMIEDVIWRDSNRYQDKRPQEKAEALNYLRAFSKRPEWWVRLYVAVMSTGYPFLLDPEVLATLERDPDPRVRRVIEGYREYERNREN
jgi:hypothetical protein